MTSAWALLLRCLSVTVPVKEEGLGLSLVLGHFFKKKKKNSKI